MLKMKRKKSMIVKLVMRMRFVFLANCIQSVFFELTNNISQTIKECEERGLGRLGGTVGGRTVTLQMLMAANMIQPGKSLLTIEYLVSS